MPTGKGWRRTAFCRQPASLDIDLGEHRVETAVEALAFGDKQLGSVKLLKQSAINTIGSTIVLMHVSPFVLLPAFLCTIADFLRLPLLSPLLLPLHL